ncbi:MAG: hypothetical protein GXO64_02080 [Candidatus Micrarchaeota archaeon]|nr:hypothetical protein [Candidatus Micrarchaeota archaeon]
MREYQKTKAQAAFEYMAIVVLVLVFIVPLWYYGFQTKTGVSDDMTLAYAKNTVSKIADTADLVYSQRNNASVRIMVHIPDGVTYTNISGGDIMMRVATSTGEVTVYEMSKANISGSIPTQKGDYYFTLKAMGDYVNLTAS